MGQPASHSQTPLNAPVKMKTPVNATSPSSPSEANTSDLVIHPERPRWLMTPPPSRSNFEDGVSRSRSSTPVTVLDTSDESVALVGDDTLHDAQVLADTSATAELIAAITTPFNRATEDQTAEEGTPTDVVESVSNPATSRKPSKKRKGVPHDGDSSSSSSSSNSSEGGDLPASQRSRAGTSRLTTPPPPPPPQRTETSTQTPTPPAHVIEVESSTPAEESEELERLVRQE